MRGGDISNEVPMRVLVSLDCLLVRETKINKVLGISVPYIETTYNRQALSYFWRFRDKYEYVLELVGFELSQSSMDNVLEDLNNLGTNPFNYATAYNVVADLVAELPYRPEVKHVIDIPDRALRYGHWYLEEGALYGSK
jgi:hypothetical protein